MILFDTYRKILGPFWPRVLAIVGLKATGGLLEVLGLVYVVHLVGARLNASTAVTAWGKWEAWLLGTQPSAITQVGLFLGLALTSVVLKHVGNLVLGDTVVRVEQRIRRGIVEASIHLCWEKFVSLRLGQMHESVLGRSQEGVYGIQACIDLLCHSVVALVFLGVSFSISVPITLILCLLLLGAGMVFSRIKNRSADSIRRIPTHLRRLTRDLETILSSLKYLRGTGQTKFAYEKYLKSLRDHGAAHRSIYLYQGVPEALLELSGILILGSLLIVTLVFRQIPLALAVTFMAIFYRLAPKVQMAFASSLHIRAREPLLRDLGKTLELMVSNQDRPQGAKRVTFSRSIEFQGVGYSYERKGFELEEFNLKVEWGECVALVGTSGGGKTTLVDLVTGLLRPKVGRIWVDGTDLEELDREFWGRQIGLVLQTTPLLHGTLLENVAMGDSHPNPRWAEACLRMASLGSALDAGLGLYSTVGQQGFRLSGGQQQRVALARALYRKPRLLILDEATSSLDSETEGLFQDELERLRGTITILMVAHRLRTVKMADKILVMENGRVSQQGAWASLIDQEKGQFYRLAQKQGLTPTEQGPLSTH